MALLPAADDSDLVGRVLEAAEHRDRAAVLPDEGGGVLEGEGHGVGRRSLGRRGADPLDVTGSEALGVSLSLDRAPQNRDGVEFARQVHGRKR